MVPKPETVKKALAEIRKRPANYEYFFGQLKSPSWIGPLFAEGRFKDPPQPIPDGDYIRFPVWPESRYLARMAAVAPEVVLRVALQIPQTENVRIHEDLVDMALAMPPQMGAKLGKKEAAWVRSKRYLYLLLPSKLGQLARHLARGTQTGVALDLLRSLLTVFPDPRAEMEEYLSNPYWSPEPQTRFDLWHYEQILKEDMPDFVAAAEQKALVLLCDLLQEAVQCSRRKREGHGPWDYSYIWRPAIEDHEQNRIQGLAGALVSAVRDAAEQLMDAHGKAILDIVEGGPFDVFRRIGLHLRRKWPNIDFDGTCKLLSDSSLLENSDLWHELFLLLKDRFGKLPPDCQNSYLCCVHAGTDIERWLDWQERETEQRPSRQDGERRQRHWQYNRLLPVQEFLDPEWRSRFETLRGEFAEPEHPEFLSYSSAAWSGPVSPKSVDELRSIGVEELLAFLRSWQPSGQPMTPSADGLGRALTALVSSDPETYALAAPALRGLAPTYVRGFLEGLREATKERTFSWLPVLDLCEWVVAQSREILGRRGEYADLDPGWVWTRKAIAGLFSNGFEPTHAEIPFDLRTRAWSILAPLTEDPEPTPEYEAQWGGPNMDWATMSINTIRGEAMHAVVRHALWVRRHIEQTSDGKERVERGFAEMQEVREILERHLHPEHDTSLAIRSVYGQWFPWLVLLDHGWATQNTPRIFPSEEELSQFRDVAWATYIAFCSPNDNVFDILHEQYGHAVDRIGTAAKPQGWLGSPDDRLAEHLMTYYWRRKIELDDPQGLLARFYAQAPEPLCAHAIEFVGRSLVQIPTQALARQILERLRALWSYRVERIRSVPSQIPGSEELAAFGWWFMSGKFDVSWAIAQLQDVLRLAGRVEPTHMVIEHLATLVGSMPMQTVECLRLIVEGDDHGWGVQAARNDVRTILATAVQSSDERVRDLAVDLIHRLGARGDLAYRDLLPPKPL